MFGYVRPFKGELKVSEYEWFRSVYCGLCRALKARYGFFATFFLNYDLTFFAACSIGILGETGVERCRCISNPFRRRCVAACGNVLAFSADLNVLLACNKLDDEVRDGGKLRYRLARLLTRRYYKKAAARQPELEAFIGERLDSLTRLERERAPSLDRPADEFAQILRAMGERVNVDYGAMLYHIGRFIYIIDAADDLEKDVGTGAYNAVSARYGELDGRAKESLRDTLFMSLEAAYDEFSKLDFGERSGFVENVLRLGLPSVMEGVLSGKRGRGRDERPV